MLQDVEFRQIRSFSYFVFSKSVLKQYSLLCRLSGIEFRNELFQYKNTPGEKSQANAI